MDFQRQAGLAQLTVTQNRGQATWRLQWKEAMNSDTPASSPDEPSVLKTYEEYVLASLSLDEKRVATYYNEPFMFVSAEKTVTVATRARPKRS